MADSIKMSSMIPSVSSPAPAIREMSFVRSNTDIAMVLAMPSAPTKSAIKEVPQAVERAERHQLVIARALAGRNRL